MPPSCPHCSWELCSEHCGKDFPLIVRELIPKCNLYLSSKSTWITNVMEIYLTSILSTVFKHLKWIDKDLAKFGGKSGHGFYFLNSIIYSTRIYFQIRKLHFWLFFKPYHYHHHCAKSHQSCPSLWDPMDRSLPGSSVPGIVQARILEWVATPSSRGRDLSDPANQHVFCLLHWQAGSLPLVLPGKQPTTTLKVLFSH